MIALRAELGGQGPHEPGHAGLGRGVGAPAGAARRPTRPRRWPRSGPSGARGGPSRWGTTARARWNTPVRLMPTMSSHTSSSVSQAVRPAGDGARRRPPRRRGRPKRSTASATAASSAAWSRTSADRRPSRRRSAAARQGVGTRPRDGLRGRRPRPSGSPEPGVDRRPRRPAPPASRRRPGVGRWPRRCPGPPPVTSADRPVVTLASCLSPGRRPSVASLVSRHAAPESTHGSRSPGR